jgi:transcriptional regulator NrdR family protein
MEENTTRECHCGGQTKIYRTRKIRGGKTVKTYHSCQACGSRFVDTWVQELANARSVSIFDLNTKEFKNANFSVPNCF